MPKEKYKKGAFVVHSLSGAELQIIDSRIVTNKDCVYYDVRSKSLNVYTFADFELETTE